MEKFYEHVNISCKSIYEKNKDTITCHKGCHSCCIDDIEVFEIEAEYIRKHASEILKKEEPHAVGNCAFLDREGACRIYSVRPYVCRTQGLPLRWTEDKKQWRDICPLNEPKKTSITLMPEDRFFNMTAYDNYLALLQMQVSGVEPRRIRLRDLFEKSQSVDTFQPR